MKIYILTENIAGGKFQAEHGLSYLIESEDKKILFDTGHSDIFLKNAELLGIDIEKEVDTVVLSHGHWDHGDGLKYLDNKKLITHPGSFIRRFRKKDLSPIGLSLSKTKLLNKFQIEATADPLMITKNLYFLGEIPRLNNFESQTTTFTDDFRNDDFVTDDSALAAIGSNEIIVITGCSHSGICNITEHAKKVTGVDKVKAVIGGFHLKYDDEQTQKTINYMKENGIDLVYPSHCTELPALSAFYNVFHNQAVKTGMIFNF
ncbi:MAG: MBL fold metallo-hydrolase [Bacteroidales bacterium]|jgi:7,8-dihydropterin-6-yl-methyl-4-(beta-D-ribofuranosyl)aminobenzene 5'-phosphate synthase|nr:MBL fold metallo-hydrolase [Bacteroidales bacterium]